YLWQLERCLNYRWLTVAFFGFLVIGTGCLLSTLGREFMPELEEGNLWIRGSFPVNISLERVSAVTNMARKIMSQYPEVQVVMSQVGRPDDGTDPGGFNNAEFFVPLKPSKDWSVPAGRDRPRTKPELIREMDDELTKKIPRVDWDFSQ